MRKVLSLIFALVFCLYLCACGNKNINTESEQNINEVSVTLDSNKIPLTLENYETYFNVSGGARFYHNAVSYTAQTQYTGIPLELESGGYQYYYFHSADGIFYSASAEAISSNFNYYDVVFKVKVFGDFSRYERPASELNRDTLESFISDSLMTEHFENTFEVKTNIIGEGSESFYVSFPCEYVVDEGFAGPNYNLYNRKVNLTDYKFEVVEVSGYITPA